MLKVSKSICHNRRFGNPTKGRHQKHDYANYDQFAPNFNVTYKTIQRVSTKFEVIWRSEHSVMGQRSWRIFCYVIWENGLVGILLPTIMAAAI